MSVRVHHVQTMVLALMASSKRLTACVLMSTQASLVRPTFSLAPSLHVLVTALAMTFQVATLSVFAQEDFLVLYVRQTLMSVTALCVKMVERAQMVLG